MYEMLQKYLSAPPLPLIPFCPVLHQGSSVTLAGLVFTSCFITAEVGETGRPLWLKWLEMEPGRWAIDSLGDYVILSFL